MNRINALLRFVFLATFLGASSSFSQFDEYTRKYSFVEDMSGAPSPKIIDFYQGERVELSIAMTRDGDPINLSGVTYTPVWGIVDDSSVPGFSVMTKTGSVVSASGGLIRFSIEPGENTFTSKVYSGYVTMTRFSGTNILDRGTVQSQSVTVRDSKN